MEAKQSGSGKSSFFKRSRDIFQRIVARLIERNCAYCRGETIVHCQTCKKPLCKNHFMACPICGTISCHPDVADCCFKHRC